MIYICRTISLGIRFALTPQCCFTFTLCSPNSAYISLLDPFDHMQLLVQLVSFSRVCADHYDMDGVHGTMFIPILQVCTMNTNTVYYCSFPCILAVCVCVRVQSVLCVVVYTKESKTFLVTCTYRYIFIHFLR